MRIVIQLMVMIYIAMSNKAKNPRSGCAIRSPSKSNRLIYFVSKPVSFKTFMGTHPELLILLTNKRTMPKETKP